MQYVVKENDDAPDEFRWDVYQIEFNGDEAIVCICQSEEDANHIVKLLTESPLS